MSGESETEDLLSAPDSVLFYLASIGGRFEGKKAELSKRLGGRDPSNVGRDLDDLKGEGLIQFLPGQGYELTEKGWRRVEPFTFVSTFLFGVLGALVAAIAAIGFAYDFFGIPVLHYGLESSAIAFALVLLWLYRVERGNWSLIVRRSKRPARSKKQSVKLT